MLRLRRHPDSTWPDTYTYVDVDDAEFFYIEAVETVQVSGAEILARCMLRGRDRVADRSNTNFKSHRSTTTPCGIDR